MKPIIISIEGEPEVKCLIKYEGGTYYLAQSDMYGRFARFDYDVIDGMTDEVFDKFVERGELRLFTDEDGVEPYSIYKSADRYSDFMLKAS